MSLNSAVLTEFGQNLGLADLQWPQSGVLALDFDVRGTLYLEDRDDDLLLYLARLITQPEQTLAILKTALQRCHYRQGLPYAVQPGLRGETELVFLVRLPSREVTLPELERVLDTLTTLHATSQA
ncbi:MAG: type III secretion chaperone SycN [Candidatus Competibacteraceae bacterium]|nr:type III secretion chaperone SycN [Candidatus Competibacteraceae bacterium]